jgi:hypothetical protein
MCVGIKRVSVFALFFGIGRVAFAPFNAGRVGATTPFGVGWVAARTFFTTK